MDRPCTPLRIFLSLIASVSIAMPAVGSGAPADPTVSQSTGAASFRIPIAVPPGPGGFAPDLALSYSSRAGDGPFGVGWSLGLPEIRCSARFGVPDFANCQHYELGDTLLVAGAEAGRYHTVVESFQRIRFFSSSNSWMVEQPNGRRLYFGESASHRVAHAPAGGHTARWLLERMEDPFGNEIVFAYDRSDLGEAYPSAITYGPAAAPGSGPREIHFLYEPRTDPRLLFVGGVERHLDRRLREIQVVSNGGIFRRYAFGYELAGVSYTTNRSRLLWVQELGGDCTAADPDESCSQPRRTFEYRDASDDPGEFANDAAYRVPFGNYVTNQHHLWRNDYPAQIGDLNGDGLPDRIEVHSAINFWLAGFRILINTGSGFSGNGPIAAAYTESFENLTYSKPYWEYQQIPTPMSGGIPVEGGWYGWNGYNVNETSMFAMCSVTRRSRPANLSQELVTRGLGAQTSTLAQLRASNGAPSDGSFEPLPSFRLVDLDADGLADLVVSTRLSGVTRHFDCNNPGQPLSDPQEILGETVTVVFRNTGSGWVNDPEAQELATGLPPFEEVIVKSTYQTEVDEPSQALLVAGPFPNSSGEDHATSPCANRSIRGFEQYLDEAGDQAKTAVCHNLIDLAPQFADFNGDGYLDLAVLERDLPDSFWTGADYWTGAPNNTPRTHVWIQKPGASQRWQRAAQYDLPSEAWPHRPWIAGLTHAGLQHHLQGPSSGSCLSWRGGFKECSPNTYRSDNGVRLADLNRDGLTDVVWSDNGQSGVFLNTGGGSPGVASSAWCASEPSDVAYVGSGCLVNAAAYRPPAPLAGFVTSNLMVSTGHLADLNGDGFLDFVSIDPILRATNSWPSWIHDPNVSSASVWRRDGSFDVNFGCVCNTQPSPNGCTAPHPDGGYPLCPNVYSPRFEALDINGDGSDDVVGDTHAFLAQSRHSDLIRTVDNGRGGSVAVEYDSMILQRDAALEADAEDAQTVPWADDAGPVALWRPAPVVSRVIVTGPNLATPGDVTAYRYAHPRFSPELRSDLGFGLAQRTRADGSAIEEYFYQDLGRTGRTARRLVKDAGAVVHRYEARWEHVTAVIPGTTAGVYLARLVTEQSLNEYSGGIGALLARTFHYHDVYGFNFVERVSTARPSAAVDMILTPEPADTTSWIVGLVRERQDVDSRSTWVSRSEFTYTGEGRLATELRHRSRGDGSDPVTDLTQYLYDASGNLRSRIDPNDHVTEFGYDETQSVLTRRTDPAVDGQPAKVTVFTPHPVFGVPIAINPGYRDIPRTELVLDAFGRVTETWSIPRDRQGEGEPARVSEMRYVDYASPPYVEQLQYVNEAGDDYIRTAVLDDGFGGAWKTIRDAGATLLGGRRFIGSATYHDPSNRISRTTRDLSCAQDDLCSGLTGAENPATVTLRDELGRPIRIDTPRGTTLSRYASSYEQIAEGGGNPNLYSVDVVWSQNAKGDLTRRSFDGDRVLAVEECTNSDPNRTSLADASCARGNGPNRTLYGYHASGQLEVVRDPLGVDGRWTSPWHQLRYRFDTAGQVIAIDDPDAGHSETFYDGAGNAVETTNSRGQQRVTQYDPLDRPKLVRMPEGDVTFRYRPEERQLQVEKGPGYSKSFLYDAFGRVFREAMSGFGVSQAAISGYDLLGRRTAITATGTMVRYEYAGAFLQRVCAVAAVNPVPCSDPTAIQQIISGVTYDRLGRRSAVQLPGGARTYTYDDDDTRDLREDQFVGASTLTHDYLTHDPLGNLLDWSIAAQPDLNASGSYTYDARNRLASWTRTADGRPAVAEAFGYDGLGNLVSHGGEAQVFEHPTKPHALTRRGAKTYAYDDSGNLTRAGSRHLTFDSADRLVCVGSAAGGCEVLRVVYDAAGVRIFEQAGGTKRGFIGPHQVRTLPSSGGEELRLDILAFGERVAYTINQKSPASASFYVFHVEVPPWLLALFPVAALAWCLGLAIRGGLLVGVARRPGAASVSGVLIVSLAIPYPAFAGGGGGFIRTWRWVLSDPLGSGLAVLDETGLLLSHTRFEPFGAVDGEYEAAPDPQRRRFFAGHPEQSETGLHYMNARWMDPETGTFLSVDPLIADSADPQSYNAYSYARNNPVNLTDPTGTCVAMFSCGMILPAYGFSSLATTSFTISITNKLGDRFSSTWNMYTVNGEFVGSNSMGVAYTGASAAQSSQSGVSSGAASARSSSAVGDALTRVGRILGWDIALTFQGIVGNVYGIVRGLVTTLAGIATLDASMIASGLSQTISALVPRFGFWSGPGWGQPNLEANGYWYGPYSSQNVIEQATHRHDQDAPKPGADRQLIHDVWSRHDLGPYGHVYRVGLTALFGARIGLGLDD